MQQQEDLKIGKQSRINSGMLQVFRLDFLWKEANKYATAGLYGKWNDVLDRVWCELAGDVKNKKKKGEEDKKDTFQIFTDLTKDYADTIKSNSKKRGFGGFEENDLINMVKQKNALIKKEIFLRKLQNKQGKGTAYENLEDDFE